MRTPFILAIVAAGSLITGCGSGQSPAETATSPSSSNSPGAQASARKDPSPGGEAGASGGATSVANSSAANSSAAASAAQPGSSQVGSGGGSGRFAGTQRAPSASREAYMAQTRAAREKGLAKAAAQAQLEEEAAAKARAGEVVYQGPAANIPKDLLSKPDIRVEVRKDRPGEVTVRRLSAH